MPAPLHEYYRMSQTDPTDKLLEDTQRIDILYRVVKDLVEKNRVLEETVQELRGEFDTLRYLFEADLR